MTECSPRPAANISRCRVQLAGRLGTRSRRRSEPSIVDHAEGLEEQREAVPECAFRRFHCNQWVQARLSPGSCPTHGWHADRTVAWSDGERVVMAFDGSYIGDSTVIVACSLESDGKAPHVELVGIWKPADTAMTVPVDAVEARIVELCGRFMVEEIVADPWLWQRSLQALAERFPVVEWPQSPSRMAPACGPSIKP